jgi:hypothetical protein
MGSNWGDGVFQATGLPHRHRRALDILCGHFGGKMIGIDLYPASITRATMRDLVDAGYVRRRPLGWEATLRTWQARRAR